MPEYRFACAVTRGVRLAQQGRRGDPMQISGTLIDGATEPRLKALVANDLAVLAAIEGRLDKALQGWKEAIDADESFLPARLNRDLINAELALGRDGGPAGEPVLAPKQTPVREPGQPEGPLRVAILSFLFNWPSTGGGNIHTVELAEFLARAGYEIKHIHARYADWQIGRVDDGLPIDSQPLEFNEASWNVPSIRARFREAVDAFAPDYVLITDAWNMKPILAEAVRGYPYLLRFQAQECLCPLNNLRLLLGRPGECAVPAQPACHARDLPPLPGGARRALRAAPSGGTSLGRSRHGGIRPEAAPRPRRSRGRAGAQPIDRGDPGAVRPARMRRSLGHGPGPVPVAAECPMRQRATSRRSHARSWPPLPENS